MDKTLHTGALIDEQTKQINKQTGIVVSLVSKGEYSISDAVPVVVAFNVSIVLMLTLMLVLIY